MKNPDPKKRRSRRTRAKIFGTAKRPRLSVFRSNRYTYAQLIDDLAGKTVAAASSQEVKSGKSKTERAHQLGELVAKRAKAAGILEAAFHRGAYHYHGRVKAVAEGARKEGLKT